MSLRISRIPEQTYVLLQNTETGELHAGHNHGYCGLSLVDVTLEQVAAAADLVALVSMGGQQYDGGCLEAYQEPAYRRVELSEFKCREARESA